MHARNVHHRTDMFFNNVDICYNKRDICLDIGENGLTYVVTYVGSSDIQ